MGQDVGVDWEVVSTPFAADLEATTHAADGAYAVGEGGIVVTGDSQRDWDTVIDQDALETDGDLHAVDATDDGERVWFAGDAGILGMYDTETGGAVGYDYRGDASAEWKELAVAGAAGEERALMADGSGAVVSFDLDGEELAFSQPTRPSEADVVAMTTTADGTGYALDGEGGVHTATESGWDELGAVDAEGEPVDIAADEDRLIVAADDGRLYLHDGSDEWTAAPVADDELLAVATADWETAALAADATVYSRTDGDDGWERTTADTGDRLVGLSIDPHGVAVGENGAVAQFADTVDEDEIGGVLDDEAESADLPPLEAEADDEALEDHSSDAEAAVENAENAAADVDAAIEDAENAVESEDAEAAVEAVEGAADDVTAAIEDAENAAAEPMDEHTQLIVEELLTRADTEDLIELLSESDSGPFAERVAELVGSDHAHDCSGDGCSCGPECDCGDDCRCDETGNCECDRCTCGHEECTCGTVSEGCTCGGNCSCGHDCDCSADDGDHAHDCCDDGCSCGPECDCGDDCACDRTGNCECDHCTCGHDECTCGTVSEGCTCGGNCDCGHDCHCGSSHGHAHDCSGGSCSCGPECDCGDDCGCDSTGNCQCDTCTCGHDECSCGTVSEGCTCGGNCSCGHDCHCGSSHGHGCC